MSQTISNIFGVFLKQQLLKLYFLKNKSCKTMANVCGNSVDYSFLVFLNSTSFIVLLDFTYCGSSTFEVYQLFKCH